MKGGKSRIARNAALIIVCTAAVLAGLLLGFKAAMEKWTDYEHYKTFSASDGGYDVELFVSYPPFPPNNALRFKMVCRDNSSGKEVKQGEYRFSVPKNGEWFSLEENASGAVFVFHNQTRDERVELVWEDMFP
ncbi:MAG: hypothetical protein NC299_14500 [Lachnospiraceae bacterium]|nr:hypothetical protein [Ruminococcus sp.]MCM1276546.1 hypothetical protein [Lachnospiraceae bacterium]